MKGRIRFLHAAACYGFVKADNGTDAFFHTGDVLPGGEKPRKGKRCSFEIVHNERTGKPNAIKIYVGGADSEV